jgi:hypothetical protein
MTNERHIETLFYTQKNAITPCKVNKSIHKRKAIMNALDKLDNDVYHGAWLAVIYDTTYGQLIRIIIKKPNGQIITMFEEDEHKPKCLTNIKERNVL